MKFTFHKALLPYRDLLAQTKKVEKPLGTKSVITRSIADLLAYPLLIQTP